MESLPEEAKSITSLMGFNECFETWYGPKSISK